MYIGMCWKGGTMPIHRLSPLEIMHAKPRQSGKGELKKSDLIADGGGLYLQVTTGRNGVVTKSWVFRYVVAGKEYKMGLGSLDTIDATMAREKARQCRIL